jgi:hypothetical protein
MLTGAMIGMGLLLAGLICLALFVVPSLMNRLGQRGNLPRSQDSISSTASAEFDATDSASPSEATGPFTPTPETAPVVLLPTSTPVNYELLIVRGGDGNSLVVINLTKNAFPLSLLQLGNGKDAIRGSAWGLDNLAGGACVGAWKAGEDREPPRGFDCQLVGSRLERKKKDLFSGETFVVFFAGEQVGICYKDQEQCSIMILP